MRLRARDLVTVYLKRFKVIEDDEGNSREGFEPIAIPIKMNVQSASGILNATIYGQRLAYIKDCKYQGKIELNEKDGICLYTQKMLFPLTLEEIEEYGYSLVGYGKIGYSELNEQIISPEMRPDYRIISIQPYSTHLNIKLEKIDANGR
ncbi:MAG: hypothetical protein ABS889_03850 [Desemzia incerta]